MSARRQRSSRTSRAAIALALGALLGALLPLATASAAKPAPTPVVGIATSIRFDDVSTVGVDLPDTLGANGLWYAVAGRSLTTTLTFVDDLGDPAPLSTNKAVYVSVSYGSTVLGTTEVAATESAAVVSLQPITDAVSNISLTASADTKPKAVRGTSRSFDVLIESSGITTAGGVIGGAGGTSSVCNATAEEQVCADLIPPVGGSFGADGLLSRGLCVATDNQCLDSYIQALATVVGGSRTNPATLIMKCDKTLCAGGAIKSKRLIVTLAPGSGNVAAPDCPAKGTVGDDPSVPFCVDYVQSTRDNAGDTFLYLLFTEDAKVRFS